jgi:hypothetical protein
MKRELLNILGNHVGKENAITAEVLEDVLGMEDSGLTSPKLRDIVRELIFDHRIPICSCGNGYYIADDVDDLERYRDTLQKNIDGNIKRRKKILEAFEVYWK